MAKAKKKAAKKAAAPKSNHVPTKILNKRLTRLNDILKKRAGGKSFTGAPS
jgi:hypothetical protein